jgi:TRAP-type C4-dicarboxylate transport system permease small subunit
MTGSRPFTLIAAAFFLLMAVAHVYRIVTHFQIIIGSHAIPMSVSYFAIVITGILAVMLYRESRS